MVDIRMPVSNEYLVTAIVSTYAAERFMRGALEDLAAQTIFPRVEVIVVDSASPQGEGRIVREFAERYPDNICYFRTANRESLYAAWNLGVRMARGKYLTSANTDDRHSPDAFERLAGALEANTEAGLAYGDYAETSVPNDILGRHHLDGAARNIEFRRDHLLVNCFVGSQPMWRRTLHEEFGYFREDLNVAGDWDFWNRVARRYRFVHVPHVTGLMYFSAGADNLARMSPEITLRETEAVADFHLRYYWADLIPRVSVIWLQEGDRDAWRRSFGSLSRQSVRPEQVLIVGNSAEEALEVWGEFPGATGGAQAFPVIPGEEVAGWRGALSAPLCNHVAYLRGDDLWEKDHLERVTDWMGETNFRLVRADSPAGSCPPSVSSIAHHSCILPVAREILEKQRCTPAAKGWFSALSEHVEASQVLRDAFYPLRSELSRQARERFRDAVCHFHRKGQGVEPRSIDTSVRPFLTFLKEYMKCAMRKGEGDAFSRAVWRGWNNWIRYALRREARERRSSKRNP